MRRLTAIIAAVALTLGFTVAIAGSADAAITAPSSGATLQGTVTLSDTGGTDNSSIVGIKHCGGNVHTTIQLISGSTVVFNQVFDGAGARDVSIDTHNYPNGAYTVRTIDGNGANSGFLGTGCTTSNTTNNNNVTITNVVALSYGGPTSAAQNTSITVSATLTDPNLAASVLPGRTVTFALSGGATVNGTTNASGVASATLAIAGPPRSATLTASFAATPFYGAKSAAVTFAVTKDATATTVTAPVAVVHGQATSFTAQVAAAEGTGTPTGSVQFTVDGNNFGAAVPLSSGSATTPSTSSLSTGSHVIGASYSGDSDFVASTAGPKTQTVNKAGTTTTLSDAPAPTVSGQAVTFTATVAVVAPGVGAPSGGVQFNVDGQPFGTAVPLTGNTATLTIANLHAGNHQVDATYNGDTDFALSSSATLTHGVNRADTNVVLSTSDNIAVSGEPLTYTAHVTAVGPGAGSPSGTVQFAADGVAIGGPVPVVGGTATSPTAHLTVGDRIITADYSGDGDFSGESDTLTQDVRAAATTTTVTSSPNPSVTGQTVTLHADVTPVSPATGIPGGAVQFLVDGDPVGVFVPLHSGAAETSFSNLTPGSHTITATYFSSDPNFVTSTSAEATQQVNKAATKTTVVSSAPTSVFGQPVTITATVSVLAPGAGAPSGTITFKDGSTVLGTAPVNSSTGEQASITTADLSVAQHAIVATYSGDDGFLTSNDSVTQAVSRAQTSTMVTSSANPAQSGQGVTFSATVTPVAPGAGDPSGTVVFTINGANLGSPATVVNGVATSTAFAALSPGTYAISATYSGDRNFVTSTGGLDQGTGQNITKGATAMTLTSSANPAGFGQAVTFTSTVSAVAPANGHPSGVVQVWEGSVLLGSTSLVANSINSSQATFVSSTLSPGSHAIRAVYVGNFNFSGQNVSISQSVGQVATVTGVESSANPSTFGDSVTLTAVVASSPASAGTPTGTVSFAEGSTALGTATIATVQGQQQASITVTGLHAGAHTIKATYAGSAAFAGSTSATFTQNVSRAATTVEAATLVTYHYPPGFEGNGGVVRATLTGVGGAPLAGRTLVFTTTQPTDHGVIHICDVVTDANGFASCDATVLFPAIDFDGGYDVTFAGDADYQSSHDHGTQF